MRLRSGCNSVSKFLSSEFMNLMAAWSEDALGQGWRFGVGRDLQEWPLLEEPASPAYGFLMTSVRISQLLLISSLMYSFFFLASGMYQCDTTLHSLWKKKKCSLCINILKTGIKFYGYSVNKGHEPRTSQDPCLHTQKDSGSGSKASVPLWVLFCQWQA